MRPLSQSEWSSLRARRVRRQRAALGLFGLAILSCGAARAAPLKVEAVYAFGDSFVEVGNHLLLTGGAIPPPPYVDGRFANGPIWIDEVAAALGLTLKRSEAGFDPDSDRAVSFAYGGAGTGSTNPSPVGVPVPGLLGQVDRFLDSMDAAATPANPDALYVVWAGSNDYLLNLTSGPAETVGNIRTALEALAGAGAQTLLVPNLPDLGRTPAVVQAGLADLFTALTQSHNALLASAMAEIGAANPDLRIIGLDVFALFDRILADPAAFGFSADLGAGPAAGCIFLPFQCPSIGPETDRVFWDEVHPTTAVHRLIADAAMEAIAVPEPPVLLLVAAGLAGLGLAAGRERRRGDPG